MRKKLIALLSAGLLLTGCATQSEPSAEWTPTITGADPNNVACRSFAEMWENAVDSVGGDSTQADWEAEAAKADEIALKAEGDVKERMLDFANDWPDLGEVFVFGELEDTNERLAAIERACAAAGEELHGLELVESS